MNNEYKMKCYNAFSFNPNINMLMNCLNNNLYNEARILMYEIEDNLVDQILSERLSSGETYIHNSKLDSLQKMNECISEIEEYIIQSENEYIKMKNENSDNRC